MSSRRLLYANNVRAGVAFARATPDNFAPLGGVTSFTRADAATCAQQITSLLALEQKAANVLRDGHYVDGWRTWLLEDTRVNRVIQSDALNTTWGQNGGALVTVNAVGTYAGRPFSSISRGAGSWGGNYVSQIVAFSGNATKEFNIIFKQNAAGAGTFPFFLQTGGGTNRLAVIVTVAAGGAVSAAASVGTAVKTWALADGAYLIQLVTTTVTAAETNIVYLGSSSPSGSVASLLVSGVHTGNGTIARMPIATTTAVVTQAADALTLAGVPITGTLFYHYFDLATAAWVSAVAAYTAGTAITPAVDRAYFTAAVLQGTRTAAECKAILGGTFPS